METSSTVGARLEAFQQLATEGDASQLVTEASELAARVREGLFYVACVGQFKRGKSTLLNALVGHPLLPVGVVPVTAVVTIIRYGEHPAARIRFATGDWQELALGELSRYVTEELNPGNRAGVAAVEVFVPSELLASGMCLVDTPGIGSVFASNTAVTRSFVPHLDAALLVLGADPPISAEELALVQEITRHCHEVLVVLNKADRLAPQELTAASVFTCRVLEERADLAGIRLFEVSATERLAGTGPLRDWPGLVETLTALARRPGADLMRTAEERGLRRLTARLRHHLEEQRGALQRPLAESEQRIESLRACVRDAERALTDLGPLFRAEQERLMQAWHTQRATFLAQAQPAARDELSQAIRRAKAHRGPALRKEAFARADEIARRRLDAWRVATQPTAEAMYAEAMRRFTGLANGLIERLAATEPSLAGLTRSIEAESGFTYRSRLYYTFLLSWTSASPAGWLLDLLRSRRQQLSALDRQAGRYLTTLLEVNANRIVGDFEDRVIESRRRFQAHIRATLAEVTDSAANALTKASERQAQGSQAVGQELAQLAALLDRLAALELTSTEPAVPSPG